MADRDAEEEFEFLVNLLASDGVESDAAGSRREGGAGLGIEKGPDGKLDLGQVKAFYERKKKEEGKEKGEGVGVGWVDGRLSTKYGRNRSGNSGKDEDGLPHSISRSVSDRGSQSVLSPWTEQGPVAPASDNTGFQGQARTCGPSPAEDSKGWVDLISEEEAKQLLLELSDALRLQLPLGGDPRSATDQPRTLRDIKNIVEFVEKMDELVWRRSKHGADQGVFDPRNISAVEERVRLWERIARGPCS